MFRKQLVSFKTTKLSQKYFIIKKALMIIGKAKNKNTEKMADKTK